MTTTATASAPTQEPPPHTVTIYPPEGGPFSWDAQGARYLLPDGKPLHVAALDTTFREFGADTRDRIHKVTKERLRKRKPIPREAWREQVLNLMQTAHKVAAAVYDGGLQGTGKSYPGRPEIFEWLRDRKKNDLALLDATEPADLLEQCKDLSSPLNLQLWEGVELLPAGRAHLQTIEQPRAKRKAVTT